MSTAEYDADFNEPQGYVPTAVSPAQVPRLKPHSAVVISQESASPQMVCAPSCPETPWYSIQHNHSYDGTSLPTRWGNGELGYLHYSSAHNLFAFEPLDAAMNTGPVAKSGSNWTFQGVLEDSGKVLATIVVVTRAAKSTDDGRYTSPDSENIGTITAYCKNVPDNSCPNVVDSSASY